MTTIIRKGDVGTLIRVDIGVDITDATVKRLIYVKPNGVAGIWAGTIADSNFITYITKAGDISLPGLWKLQSYIETPSGKWYGDLATFTVQDRLMEPVTTTTTTTTTTI